MSEAFIISTLIIFIYATCWFAISVIKKRNDVADIAWGLGYIILCLYYIFTQEYSLRSYLLYALVMIWGLRLSLHISTRNKGKAEDFRYLQWRKEWGKLFLLRSYFQVYILQGLLLLVIISPITLVSNHPQSALTFLDFIGILTWTFGFYFQAMSDYQLLRFTKNPQNKGKIMQTGLWKYSRHPNYFGEVTMWWGIFMIAVNSPYGMYTIISPVVITLLILFVSGVPMLEKRYDGNAEYATYRKKTNAFIPWSPSSGK